MLESRWCEERIWLVKRSVANQSYTEEIEGKRTYFIAVYERREAHETLFVTKYLDEPAVECICLTRVL